MMKTPPLALYVHTPWCERKCPYCDFNSYAAPRTSPGASSRISSDTSPGTSPGVSPGKISRYTRAFAQPYSAAYSVANARISHRARAFVQLRPVLSGLCSGAGR